MTADEEAELYVAKAEQAALSARTLLTAGDIDGACNRAYYAMFDAARALLVKTFPDDGYGEKSHGAIITSFGLHLVKPGTVPKDLGRNLNRSQELRSVADYRSHSVSEEDAALEVQHSEEFVSAIREQFFRN